MKQTPGQRPFKDERDEQIDTHSKSAALDFVIAATQILTIMCLIKGNPAWKGTLSVLFFRPFLHILLYLCILYLKVLKTYVFQVFENYSKYLIFRISSKCCPFCFLG